jgi:type I restriction enzyme R subunit
MQSFEVRKTGEGDLALRRSATEELPPVGTEAETGTAEPELEPLSEIIRHLNERFGSNLSDEAAELLEGLEQKLAGHPAITASFRVNTLENARLTFDSVADDLLQDTVESHFGFYKQFVEDAAFRQTLLEVMYQRYVVTQGNQSACRLA